MGSGFVRKEDSNSCSWEKMVMVVMTTTSKDGR